MADNSTPPKDVINNSRRGRELRRRYGVGNKRAPDLSKAAPVSDSVIDRMTTFFDNAPRDFAKMDGDRPSRAAVDWLLWGGAAGERWCRKMAEEMEAEADAKDIEVEIQKVDKELGIVFGYAIVCKQDGKPYFDVQGDHIPEDAMLEATAEFMSGFRIAKDMHAGKSVGQVVYGFPVTDDIAKALGITADRTGFIVGMKPDSDEMLQKYAKGEYTGFSIGGKRIEQHEAENA